MDVDNQLPVRLYRSPLATPQIKGMRGALARVLGDTEEERGGDDSISQEDLASVVAQLREARSLLREQDAIMFAAIFDKYAFGLTSVGVVITKRRACI